MSNMLSILSTTVAIVVFSSPCQADDSIPNTIAGHDTTLLSPHKSVAVLTVTGFLYEGRVIVENKDGIRLILDNGKEHFIRRDLIVQVTPVETVDDRVKTISATVTTTVPTSEDKLLALGHWHTFHGMFGLIGSIFSILAITDNASKTGWNSYHTLTIAPISCTLSISLWELWMGKTLKKIK
jgi:hypothetical protein